MLNVLSEMNAVYSLCIHIPQTTKTLIPSQQVSSSYRLKATCNQGYNSVRYFELQNLFLRQDFMYSTLIGLAM